MAKVLISMPDEFLEKVDTHVQKQAVTRSEFIRSAVLAYAGSKTVYGVRNA